MLDAVTNPSGRLTRWFPGSRWGLPYWAVDHRPLTSVCLSHLHHIDSRKLYTHKPTLQIIYYVKGLAVWVFLLGGL